MKKLVLILVLLVCISGCAFNGRPYSNIRNIHSSTGTNIVCFGDSLTAGQGAGPGEDYPSILCRELDIPVINLGRSGDTTDKAISRIDEVLNSAPKIVIVEFGANDYLSSLNGSLYGDSNSRVRAFENLEKIISELQAAGSIVVIAGIKLDDEYLNGYKKLAQSTGSALVPDILDGIYGDPALMSRDNIHPNAKGYEKMAETFMKILRPLIAESGMR